MANTSTKNAQAKSRYTPALWLIDLTNDIRICETDIKNILAGKPLTLALQLRAYDLLDEIAGYQPLNEQISLLVTQLNLQLHNCCREFYKIGRFKFRQAGERIHEV